ncbi:periplasmic chaperone for outer membrane proteins SurA [Bacteroides luti]|jgi:Parvulin-like peptidyl-prolyl isomerase|uniref:Periplasmic chaperone for outer membrane proteins SurA n=2 Tax=Bacteroides luti TaxID=1297750 RepID=A0A1M5FPS1_9BACE|nr:periplasmic chaperone for outer membrane proteins SurA [Bacteroides luti]
MKRMKKLVNFKTLVLLFVLCTSQIKVYAQDNVIDEVVWIVGDEAILKSDVEEERLNAQYNGVKFEGDPYCVIPEQIAIQKLYLHQAAIDSVEVTDSEVMQQVEWQINNIIRQIGSKEKMEEYFNKTYTQIRETMRESAREKLTVERMQKKLVGDIKITPAEVRKYFKELPQDSVPFIPTQVEVQIITQQPKIPIAEIDDVKKRLREYSDRVTSGDTPFSSLAILYSEDPGSARRGGELGFMGKGELLPEFAAVAFNLSDPKKVSKIVETEYGFHIIQLIEKRGDRINCRHILLKPRVSDKDLQAAMGRLDSVANDIRSNKFTFDQAASVISHDKETRNNNGLMANSRTSTSKFEMDQLPQEVAKAVDKLNIGEISKAFTMVNDKGKQVCAVVKLKSRIDGHKATITDDYQNLKELVLSKIRAQKLDQWIKDKQKKTYVRINEGWKKCDFKYPGWVK